MNKKALLATLVAVSAPVALIASYAAATCAVPPTPPPGPPFNFIACQSDNGYFGFSSATGADLFLSLNFGDGSPVFAVTLGYDRFGDHIAGCIVSTDQEEPGRTTTCSENIFFHDLLVSDG
jgi:hypothetical protein